MSIMFCPLFSGSSGNALFVQAGTTRLLIDAGKSGKAVTTALASIGVDPASISALLITHEHSDHISAAGVLARKYRWPIYATEGTWAAMQRKLGEIPKACVRTFTAGEDFYLGDFGVMPFAIPHDAADPVGYRLYSGGISIATATDLGHFSKDVAQRIAGAGLVLLESNHDPDMLQRNPHYTAALKKRILGKRGHLSNDCCADALIRLIESGVRQVILGHLSGENNTPELALNTSLRRLEREGIRVGEDVLVELARRDETGKVFTIKEIG